MFVFYLDLDVQIIQIIALVLLFLKLTSAVTVNTKCDFLTVLDQSKVGNATYVCEKLIDVTETSKCDMDCMCEKIFGCNNGIIDSITIDGVKIDAVYGRNVITNGINIQKVGELLSEHFSKDLYRIAFTDTQFRGVFDIQWFLAIFPNLEYIKLDTNKFISGDNMLSFIGNSTLGSSMKQLKLSGTRFGATLPDNFGSLTDIVLDGVTFSSFDWEPFFMSSNLINIQIVGVQKHSEIPNDFGKLTSLEELKLSDMNLYGEIPDSLCDLKNLTYLVLSGNSLSGDIPTCIGTSLIKLEHLSVLDNQLTSIPEDIFDQMIALEQVEISDNDFSGKMPNFGNNLHLHTLVADNLAFDKGPLPEVGPSLRKLLMSNCTRSGEIPASYIKLKNSSLWQKFWVANNELSGTIPPLAFSCDNIGTVDLSFNQFSGILDLNKFFWDLPEDAHCDMASMKTLRFGNNGNLQVKPSDLHELISVSNPKFNPYDIVRIDFRNIGLTGHFDPSFPRGYDYMHSFDVGDNPNLSGSLPSNIVMCEVRCEV
eukprot:TRINITY_DN6837_c0_g1_i2.p1 TRINITY_DN6837_c0_g1~~TRINITY_DN6837_c0_g1_i2.p1  ORF type:complete len:537 (+),score=94.33 TRINITY_DN6837_c0_g1_i2:82-1692(+)